MRQEFLGTNIFEIWEQGAQELEKTPVGKVITAPIRLPGAIVSSATETVKSLPSIVKTVPTVLLLVAAGVAGYLIFAGRKGTKLIPG